MKNYRLLLTTLLAFLVFSCQEDAEDQQAEITEPGTRYMSLSDQGSANARTGKKNLAVFSAEYLTSGESNEVGTIIYFNNRGNKKLAGDFAPDAYLEETDGTNDVSYYVDNSRPSDDLPVEVTNDAIDRAMATWDGVTCSDLGMFEVPYDGRTTGFILTVPELAVEGYEGSSEYVADVVHAGWLPAVFFDLLAEGGSEFILGVTFTIVFTDDDGNYVDANNDGRYDVAWREIYYNDAFAWNDGATYDVETIALHEAGHGLSQGHFGKAFRTAANGKLHFSPRAVMNAAYSGIQTEIEKTDNAGHCSSWASWPSK